MNMNRIPKNPLPTVERPRGLRVLQGTQSCCRVAIALRSPNAVALAEDKGIVHIYNYYGQRLSFIKAHKDRINGLVEIAPYTVVTAGNDGFVRVWDLANAQVTKSQLLFEVNIPGNVITSALFAPSQDTLVLGTLYGNLVLYAWNDRKLHRLEEIKRAHQARINSIHGYDELLVTASNDDSVSLWRIKENNKLVLIKTISLKQPVYSVAVSANYIAIGMKGALLICKNEEPTFTVRSIVPVPFGVVWCLKWTHNEKLLISGDSVLTFFDPHLATIVKRVQTDAILVIDVDFLSRSTLVVTGKGKFSSAIVWLNNAKQNYTETPSDHGTFEEHDSVPLEDGSDMQPCTIRYDANTRSNHNIYSGPSNSPRVKSNSVQHATVTKDHGAEEDERKSKGKCEQPNVDHVENNKLENEAKGRNETTISKEGERESEEQERNEKTAPQEGKKDYATNFEKLNINTAYNGTRNVNGSHPQSESPRISGNGIHVANASRTKLSLEKEKENSRCREEDQQTKSEVQANDNKKRERSLTGFTVQLADNSTIENPESKMRKARKVEQSSSTVSKLTEWKGFGLSRSDFQALDLEKIAEAMAAFMLRYKPNWGNKFKPLSSCLYKFFDSNMLTADDLFGIHAIEANELTSKIKIAMDEDKSVGNAIGLRNGVKRFFACFDTSTSKN